MAHAWIRRAGPFEVIPIPGAIATLPTFYEYQHLGLTDSKELFVAAKEAGLNMSVAESIGRAPGHPSSPYMTRVVEKELENGKTIGFDWKAEQINPPYVPSPLGIRHRWVSLQGWTADDPNDVEKVAEADDRGLVYFYSQDNELVIRPDPKSALAKFGSEIRGRGHEMSIDFTATIITTELSE